MNAARAGTRATPAATGIGALLVLVAACVRAQSADDGAPSVTPYRPTVSDPADLSAPGWLEGEIGGLSTWSEAGGRDDSVPWLLKYSFDQDHGLLVGGNLYLGARAPGGSTRRSIGDTAVEWKQRFPVTGTTAFGVEAGVVLPTAGSSLGIGEPEWLVNGIFSADAGKLHVDLNLGESHFAAHALGGSAWQTSWAASSSTMLTEKWGAAIELSGTWQRGAATRSQGLFALNYNVSNRLALDAGVACGLARLAHDRSLFAGATVLLGRPF